MGEVCSHGQQAVKLKQAREIVVEWALQVRLVAGGIHNLWLDQRQQQPTSSKGPSAVAMECSCSAVRLAVGGLGDILHGHNMGHETVKHWLSGRDLAGERAVSGFHEKESCRWSSHRTHVLGDAAGDPSTSTMCQSPASSELLREGSDMLLMDLFGVGQECRNKDVDTTLVSAQISAILLNQASNMML